MQHLPQRQQLPKTFVLKSSGEQLYSIVLA